MAAPIHIPNAGLGEFPTSERCFITELLNHPSRPETSLARARVQPGVTTQLHALDVEETYVIELGSGLMEVGDERFRVGPGDSVRIPAGIAQRIENDGATDLVFLCLCQPRFRPESYVNLEASVDR
ncbi:cupin domain-containing protein [Pleomorphomonas sp. JP5]|uniref:cupin domain-containing protein n=1 Tax=Pleomorphomonas sp. JP5 TaxID=2942998 RepID=UPI002043C1F8|nr:cupin domain-containing protein [Pleomorphomonas sp. JP5]MCM5558041.1 cupin domain-containing protein [Pleomorphomonas sp. JP5]